MLDLWNYLKSTQKPVVLYGMGNGADKIIAVAEKYNIKISGVFSSDGFVRKKTFHGFDVTDYATAKQRFGNMIVLLCFGTALPDVIENIKKIAREQELYAPDVPVYGDVLFNMDYVLENKALLKAVYNRLADQTSKRVFESAVYYKLTGKIDYLFECATSPDEVYKNILRLGGNETYFDLGAYRGDTVEEFLSRTDSYKKIIAVEPDKKTFNKLCLATENIKNILNINACVSDACGEVAFDMCGSRGSSLKCGDTTVQSVTIDCLARDNAPTYIKMDIEGQELAAIRGGADTIRHWSPKMLVSAYHRSEDLIALPEAILSINPEYKMYLRHFDCLPCWDMAYYFV